MDPSIWLLSRGAGERAKDEEEKLQEFNLYLKDAPAPPYSPEFLARFRAAQIARNRRITRWCELQIAARDCSTNSSGGSASSSNSPCFIVEGTMMEPRWLDLNVDRNDRPRSNWCFLGKPEKANASPTGLARMCTHESWLSQWSYDRSNADGVEHAARVTVPTFVLENSADDGVPSSHVRALYTASGAADKTFAVVKGVSGIDDSSTSEGSFCNSRVH